MKHFVTLATVLLVGLASVQAAQTDDQQKKKKKKKAQTTSQTTSAQTTGGAQTSKNRGKPQTSNQQVGKQKSKQQVTNPSLKPVHSNTGAAVNTNQRNDIKIGNRSQFVQRTNKSKNKNQTNVVTNNNVQLNKKAFRHFKRTGNELSFSAARRWNWRERHERDWWRRNNFRLVLYGGGYWYWNNGWWYPAYGYDPYYSHYVYDGPIFGYGQAAPGDVTAEVQRALAQQGYYYGPIDGILGRGTRGAIERYQIDHGLAVTAAIDEPTLATLGLT